MFFAFAFSLLLASGHCANVRIPELPVNFFANVTVMDTGSPSLDGLLWVAPQKLRVDVAAYGHIWTSLELFDWNEAFTVQDYGVLCMNHPIPEGSNIPFVIPPYANYVGTRQIRGIVCELWTASADMVVIKYYVLTAGSRGTLVRLEVEAGSVATRMEFNDVRVGQQDPALFDPTRLNCTFIPPPFTGFNVSGTVLDTYGYPLFAEVYMEDRYHGELPPFYTTTDEYSGLYRFANVPSGNYSMTVYADGYFPSSRVLSVDGDLMPGYQTNFMLQPIRQANKTPLPHWVRALLRFQ